jgi:hypothetical protein
VRIGEKKTQKGKVQGNDLQAREAILVPFHVERKTSAGINEAGERQGCTPDGGCTQNVACQRGVGIREKKPALSLADYLRKDFIPYVESKHATKPGTMEYYRDGANSVLKCDWSREKLDQISDQHAQQFAAKFSKLSHRV